MDLKNQLLARALEADKQYLPHLSIDPVVFGFDQKELKVLLTKMKYSNNWLLPGGYVGKEENLDKAVTRILADRAGISDVFLEQFGVFGDTERVKDNLPEFDSNTFFRKRFVSIGYYALYNSNEITPVSDEISLTCEWVYLSRLPEIDLAIDHQEIIQKALLTLREKISIKPIGLNLLPEKFKLSELQNLYEAILDRKLNRGNFYTKIKNLGILTKLNEKRSEKGQKASTLFSFDVDKYRQAQENNFKNW